MKFLTKEESETWIAKVYLSIPDNLEAVCMNVENQRYRAHFMASKIISFLNGFNECLFLIRETGIWPSSENWHLFYRLRKSYGEIGELSKNPGHLFYSDETSDLVSYVGLAIQFGWGGDILDDSGTSHIILSHDGIAELHTVDASKYLEELNKLAINAYLE